MHATPARSRALVLFSGGQDSSVCLAWALQHYPYVETIGFDYGQRHSVELDCRARVVERLKTLNPAWAAKLGPDHVLDLGVLGDVSDTALTDERAIEYERTGLPITFVPARNIVFFTFAAAVAYRRNLGALVGGMCETDYSGYPDCRDDTLKSLQVTLSLGLDTRFIVEPPLMWTDKAGTWALAERLGGQPLIDLIVEETHTCYVGDHRTRHEWGYGCGTCPACELRERGWELFRGWREA